MKNVSERDSELLDLFNVIKLFWRACPQNPLTRSCLAYGKGLVTALKYGNSLAGDGMGETG